MDQHGVSLTGGTGRGVSGNTSMGGGWTPAALKNARSIDLGEAPVSPAGLALCAAVCDLLGPPPRGRENAEKRRGAVGAIVGASLKAWLKKGRAVFQARHAEDFTAEPVGFRSYCRADDDLTAAGLIERSKPMSYETNTGGSERKAARLRPSAALVKLAEAHGVTADTVEADFEVQISAIPPHVAPDDLVQIRPMKPRQASRRDPASVFLLPTSGPQDVGPLRQEVEEVNAFVASHVFAGCRPPRFYRVFSGDIALGGRWYVSGSGNYLNMPTARRERITIDGQPIVGLDMKAAHLTILAALNGVELPPGDPYALPGIGRDVVKHYLVLWLGNGNMPTRWPPATDAEIKQAVASKGVRGIGRMLIERYPFLRDPASPTVAAQTGLDQLTYLGDARHLLTHRLQRIEAEAITLAMRRLRRGGVVVLPLHDALLVPAAAATVARGVLAEVCGEVFGVVPQIELKA